MIAKYNPQRLQLKAKEDNPCLTLGSLRHDFIRLFSLASKIITLTLDEEKPVIGMRVNTEC